MKKKMLFNLVTLIIFMLFTSNICSVMAAKAITIDEDVYNLYVDEYPDGIYENIYAKFKSAKSNFDDYYLNLSSYDSEEIFTAALDASKINHEDKLQASMTATLYRQGDEEDKKVTDSIELLLPLPDDAQEHPEDIQFYSVSGGKVKDVNYTLVEADDIYYAQFSLSSYTTYGFLFNDPYSYEEEEDLEDEEYTEDEDEEADEEEDDEEADITEAPDDTNEPTKAADKTVTVTPEPKDKADKNEIKPSSGSDKEAKAAKDTKETGKVKDSAPKTGDDFPLELLILCSVVALCALAFTIYKLKKGAVK